MEDTKGRENKVCEKEVCSTCTWTSELTNPRVRSDMGHDNQF